MKNLIKIYSQKRITEKGNKGWLFTFVTVLAPNTVSTEKKVTVWIEDKKEAYDYHMRNYELYNSH